MGEQQIHLIPNDEPDAVSPRHYAIHVDDVQAARGTMAERGVEVKETVPIAGADRFFIADPDGNIIEAALTVLPGAGGAAVREAVDPRSTNT